MTIEEVKRKYEKKWLDKPGVVSVGIGLNKQGIKVIKIGMEKMIDKWPKNIPKKVKGFTVEIYYSGKIKAGN